MFLLRASLSEKSGMPRPHSLGIGPTTYLRHGKNSREDIFA